MKFNLLFFTRLLLRHIVLLIMAPIVVASLVFFLTKKQPKTYESKARLYTGIASGSSVELSATKLDFRATNTAYDNLLNLIRARTTIEIVGLKLFAQHMAMDSFDNKIISKAKYAKLMEIVPEEVKNIVIKGDIEATYKKLKYYKDTNHSNFVYELINLKHPDYSVEKIVERIKVKRVFSSDFVDIEFESEDPGICQNTLLLLSNVFVKLNAESKENQSDAVVQYFNKQLLVATKDLEEAEGELLAFNKTHNIINYYEQTKHLASEKEHFELEYQKVFQRHFGAKAVLKTLELRLDAQELKRLSSESVMSLRNQLADMNFNISMKTLGIETDSIEENSNTQDLDNLRQRSKDTETKLKEKIEQMYSSDYDRNSLGATDVLKDWLENIIVYESTKAQLKVMDEKRLEFKKLYQVFSPLGSTMKRLERKIDITEREYLSLLHNLGLAKLKQQNVALQSDIKLMEAPFFPIDPKPSKRKIIVIAAGLMGFIIVVFTILVLELLDGNINTVQRAEKKIGLKVSSIFPVILENSTKMDYDYLRNKAVNAISRNILLNQFKKPNDKEPIINMFFSTQEGEGKTFVCQNLLSKLSELEYRTLHISYDKFDISSAFDLGLKGDCYCKLTYPINDQLYKVSSITEFDVDNKIEDFSKFDFVVLEIPSIIKNPFPVKLAASMDYKFLVTRANRAWAEADKNALKLFNEATTGPEPTIILNGVKVQEMETVIGDLPKKRGIFRKWVKQFVQFNFFTKKNVA